MGADVEWRFKSSWFLHDKSFLDFNKNFYLESDEDLFGESKPKSKFEDDSPFGKKGGMFSGGGTLFDDDGVSLVRGITLSWRRSLYD